MGKSVMMPGGCSAVSAQDLQNQYENILFQRYDHLLR